VANRAQQCPPVITIKLDRTQEVAGSIPASSTFAEFPTPASPPDFTMKTDGANATVSGM
jgi:hypothetical protein